MKRPYREGDRFSVPIGGGRFATGIVTHGTSKAITGSFFDAAGDVIWTVRFSDRALVQRRWPLLGSEPGFEPGAWPVPESTGVCEPGVVERTLAARLRGEVFVAARKVVRDVGAMCDPDAFEMLAPDVRLQWREPLAPEVLARVASFVEGRPETRIRLYGDAVRECGAIAEWKIASLGLDGANLPGNLPAFAHVRELVLDGIPQDLATIPAAFPSLEILRVRARGGRFDASALERCAALRVLDVDAADVLEAPSLRHLANLRVLDVRDSRFDDADAVLRVPCEALRLARIAGVRSIDALAGRADLRVLSLAGLVHVDSVRAIATLPNLESLELTGMWQFAVEDVAFVEHLPSLRRLRLDIGGRRKNVELYRRRSLAEPLPFGAA